MVIVFVRGGKWTSWPAAEMLHMSKRRAVVLCLSPTAGTTSSASKDAQRPSRTGAHQQHCSYQVYLEFLVILCFESLLSYRLSKRHILLHNHSHTQEIFQKQRVGLKSDRFYWFKKLGRLLYSTSGCWLCCRCWMSGCMCGCEILFMFLLLPWKLMDVHLRRLMDVQYDAVELKAFLFSSAKIKCC